jgi:UDP-3-O-[3-hydroxymyristoyl] glucosamine N-acyltransferase
MKLSPARTLKEITAILNAEFSGEPSHIISGLNEVNKVEAGDLMFVDHPKYYDKALASAATTIIINKKVDCPQGKALIFADEPFTAYNKLVNYFYKETFSLKHLSDSATVGEDTVILPGAYIGNNVKIGSNCVIHPGVVVYDNVIIGNNVTIHANAVIGGHAFYYKKRTDRFEKLISCGRVIIEDDVEIGACSTVDKGVSGDTIIGKGTKMDNHVHIGHDTVVGKMCLFAAQVGVSGAVVIEDGVTLWGQVGVPSKLRIGKGAVFLGQSAPAKSVEGGKTYLGSPADDSREKMRELIALKQLPDLIKKIGDKK